jgi:hypothetical protein
MAITDDRLTDGHYCTSAASYDAVLSRFRDEIGIASDPSRAGNDRNANAGGTGLHAWLDTQAGMKAVSAMLTGMQIEFGIARAEFLVEMAVRKGGFRR